MPSCSLVVHDIRSCYNVGSLFRAADGLGVIKIYLTGYTPYPVHDKDVRLPYLAQKITHQIHKTALGAEQTVPWEHTENILNLISLLKAKNYQLVGLEQTPHSIPLQKFRPRSKLALIIGKEVGGIDPEILKLTDSIIEIPMAGKKDSFNVAQATVIALYYIKHLSY